MPVPGYEVSVSIGSCTGNLKKCLLQCFLHRATPEDDTGASAGPEGSSVNLGGITFDQISQILACLHLLPIASMPN